MHKIPKLIRALNDRNLTLPKRPLDMIFCKTVR